MKTRGTRGGILLSLEPGDSAEALEFLSDEHRALLSNKVIVEIADKTPFNLLEAIAQKASEAGGQLAEIKPPGSVLRSKGETLIISRTIRSGGLVCQCWGRTDCRRRHHCDWGFARDCPCRSLRK
jgi:hypothetical protein